QEIGVRGKSEAPSDAVVETGAVLQPEKALRCPLAGDEWAIALVDVAGDELGAFRVGPCDDNRGDAADIGCKPRRIEVPDRSLGRDQHLAAQMAALLLRRDLLFEVNAG